MDDTTTVSTALVRPHWHYDYDSAGNMIAQTDPRGTLTTGSGDEHDFETQFAYDEAGRRILRTVPGGGTERDEFDALGRPTIHVDFAGQVSLAVYDDSAAVSEPERLNLGRLVYRRYFASESAYATYLAGTGTAAEQVHYTYDDLGRMHTVDDAAAGGTTTYTYDGEGRETLAATPQGDVHHEFDPATGRLVHAYTANTDTVYGYDDAGRLATVTAMRRFGGTWSAAEVTNYTYDANSNLATVKLPTGVVSRYAYDDLDRLIGLDEFADTDADFVLDTGETVYAQYAYELESDGKRLSATEHLRNSGSGGTFSDVRVAWEYDDAGRLITETRDVGAVMTTAGVPNDAGDYVDEYGFDLNGNRVVKGHLFYDGAVSGNRQQSTAYDYDDDGDDLLMTETQSETGESDIVTGYTYDDNGSMQTKSLSGQTTWYLYDKRNRLTGTSLNDDGDSEDAGESVYAYDSDDARVGRTERAATGGAVTETVFLSDKENPTGYAQVVEELAAVGGEPVVTYVLGHDVISQSRAATGGDDDYLLYDGHDATGIVAGQRYDYDAYGVLAQVDPGAGAAVTTLLYSGEQYDSGLGMQYLRARYYDQNVGRFSSFDSFEAANGDPASLHKYAYGDGDPIRYVDPSGNFSLLELGFDVGKIAGRFGIQASKLSNTFKNVRTLLKAINTLAKLQGRLWDQLNIIRDMLHGWEDFAEMKNLLKGKLGTFAHMTKAVKVDVPKPLEKRLASLLSGLGSSSYIEEFMGSMAATLVAAAFGFSSTDIKTSYQGLDGLMKNKSGTFLVIEAKGGTSRLSDGQMSKGWITKRLDSIVDKSRNSGSKDKALLALARKTGNVSALVVRLDITRDKIDLYFQVQSLNKIKGWGPNL